MKTKVETLSEIKKIGISILEKDDDTIRHIERKAEIILGFLGIVFSIFIYLSNQIILIYDFKINCFVIIFKILVTLIFLSLFISAIFAFLTLITRTFYRIDFNKIWEIENKETSDIDKVNIRLIEHICKINNKNKSPIEHKAIYINNSFIFLTIGLGISFILLLTLLFNQ